MARSRIERPWGVVEWLRPGERERALRMIDGLSAIGARHVRIGVSWADWHRPDGEAWYGWLLPELARTLEVLPCFHYTPPSLSLDGTTTAPPRDPKSYADFLDVFVSRHGRHFDWVELWNEPNNLNDWNWHLDAEWRAFSEMVGSAAYWMKERGKRTVLGGMCPTDSNWLALMCRRGVMAHIDAVGVHGFPETWNAQWQGWEPEIESVREVLARHGCTPEVWITEAGHSTWRHQEGRQLALFLDALAAPAERVYWYSYQDLDPELESQEGFHFDERHYHTGIVRADGQPKLVHRALASGGLAGAKRLAREVKAANVRRARPAVLVTGGAGFLGSNIAARLAETGEQVVVFDSLARARVEENLQWLRARYPSRIAVEVGDVRDYYALRAAARDAKAVVHLAAQVAVTTSLAAPIDDFEVNARGSLNLLEALRHRPSPPPVLFASTNKVYGALLDAETSARRGDRYLPTDPDLARHGVGEGRALDLRTPYGCSKGIADQYILDYARTFGVPATVFRMSCLYGPRQFGTEDQGWVAHFLISALAGRPITIYGDGCQVRDVLYADDVVAAYLLALKNTQAVAGRAFNLGGGPENAISLRDLVGWIGELTGRTPDIDYAAWRPGDQVWYASDTRRFRAATGWRPHVKAHEGVAKLHAWLTGAPAFPLATAPLTAPGPLGAPTPEALPEPTGRVA